MANYTANILKNKKVNFPTFYRENPRKTIQHVFEERLQMILSQTAE